MRESWNTTRKPTTGCTILPARHGPEEVPKECEMSYASSIISIGSDCWHTLGVTTIRNCQTLFFQGHNCLATQLHQISSNACHRKISVHLGPSGFSAHQSYQSHDSRCSPRVKLGDSLSVSGHRHCLQPSDFSSVCQAPRT